VVEINQVQLSLGGVEKGPADKVQHWSKKYLPGELEEIYRGYLLVVG